MKHLGFCLVMFAASLGWGMENPRQISFDIQSFQYSIRTHCTYNCRPISEDTQFAENARHDCYRRTGSSEFENLERFVISKTSEADPESDMFSYQNVVFVQYYRCSNQRLDH